MPSWIIAGAGTLNLPLALPALGLADQLHAVALFAFAIGTFFGLITFVLVFARLLFQASPPPESLAALLVLTAPFSISYGAYRVVSGSNDLYAQSIFMVLLLLLAVLLVQLRHLRQCCPFRVSWWAVSFPLAAASVASLHFAHANPGYFSTAVAVTLLAITTLVVTALGIRTISGLLRGELRQLVGLK